MSPTALARDNPGQLKLQLVDLESPWQPLHYWACVICVALGCGDRSLGR